MITAETIRARGFDGEHDTRCAYCSAEFTRLDVRNTLRSRESNGAGHLCDLRRECVRGYVENGKQPRNTGGVGADGQRGGLITRRSGARIPLPLIGGAGASFLQRPESPRPVSASISQHAQGQQGTRSEPDVVEVRTSLNRLSRACCENLASFPSGEHRDAVRRLVPSLIDTALVIVRLCPLGSRIPLSPAPSFSKTLGAIVDADLSRGRVAGELPAPVALAREQHGCCEHSPAKG